MTANAVTGDPSGKPTEIEAPKKKERGQISPPEDRDAETWKRLAKALSDIPEIPKTKQGHNYKYADLADVMTAVRPVLAKVGLSISQQVDTDVETRANWLKTLVIDHATGNIVQLSRVVLPSAKDPQHFGTLVSYYRRYCLGSALGIIPEDDTDGAGVQFKGPDQRPAQTSRQPQRPQPSPQPGPHQRMAPAANQAPPPAQPAPSYAERYAKQPPPSRPPVTPNSAQGRHADVPPPQEDPRYDDSQGGFHGFDPRIGGSV